LTHLECDVCFHNNSLGFQFVQPSKHMWTLHFVSTAMKVTCSSGWGDRHTQGVFKSCVLQHPENA